jgi:acyl-CoA synthetase (NDP forming)
LATAMLLAHQPVPAGRRVAIVSNAGGPGILAADACAGAGLEVPELSETTQQALRALVARDATVRNPIDLVAGATADQFEQALRVVIDDEGIDALLAIFVPPLVTRAEDVARAIANAAEVAGDKPVVACFLGKAGVPAELRGVGGRRTIPSFAFPEAAAHALGRVAGLADWRRRPVGSVPVFDDVDLVRARSIVAETLAAEPDGTWLDQGAAGALLECFGIPVVGFAVVADPARAVAAADELGYPVALKAGAAAIVHKTDVGGVKLGLGDATQVERAYREMERSLGDAMGGAVVQQMVPSGVETIVGITHDPSFGPLVMFGLGGVTAELLADRAFRIVPITDEDAHDLVRSLRGSPLLFGYRGSAPVDVGALENLLMRVGYLADELADVAETDLNPVIVGPDGVVAVDVKIRVAPTPATLPADFRRMRF